MITNYVEQSYAIFNSYGKDPQALSSITNGFWVALKEFPNHYIAKAFDEWLLEETNMPVPSQIRDSIRKSIRLDDERQKLASEPRALPAKTKHDFITVPWAYMTAEDFKEAKQSLLPQMKKHVVELVERKGKDHAKSYIEQYLINSLKYELTWQELVTR